MDLGEVGYEGMEWMDLAEDRDGWRRAVVNAAMNLRVLLNAGNFFSSCEAVSFSITTLPHGVSLQRRGLYHSSLPFM
jgi:hypothetical protein